MVQSRAAKPLGAGCQGREPAAWRVVGLAIAFLGAIPGSLVAQPPAESRPGTYDVVTETNVMIPMPDGVRLAADIYRPAREGKPVEGRFPTLLTRTPYGKGNGGLAEGKFFAARGYVVVSNDVRGRYQSEGTWRLIVDDPQDGFTVVEWIAEQPWSDGKVGTFGTSYPGGTQHALAEMNPPHLTTVVPVDALSNCGVAGMRHGGAFELRFVNWPFQIGAPSSKAALADPRLQAALAESGRRIREHVDAMPILPGNTPLRVVPEYEAWLVEALRSGPESPMWHTKGMSVVDHVADYADVPGLHVTGWYDSWTRQVTMNFEALKPAKRSPQHLVIGPWTHGGQGSNVAGEVEFSPQAAIDLNGVRLGWYDHWMRGQASDDRDPAVWIYVMGTGDDRKSAAGRLQHGGFWRAESEWPLARAQTRSLYLSENGRLDSERPDGSQHALTFRFDPDHPVPTIGGNISSNQGLMSSGGFDQRPRDDTHAATNRLPLSERPDVLVYRTDPLPLDLEVTGTVSVHLTVSSTAPDTDFTAKLIDEIPPNSDYPLGFDLNIGDSILRMRYRDGLDHQAEPMRPGETYKATITLYPTSNVFKKGHRLRIDVSSSNYPRFDVNPNTGDPLGRGRQRRMAENAVHHAAGASYVELPVISHSP
jgi:putative CocE/NonD family hydrolase